MARTLRFGIALALAAASLLTVFMRLPKNVSYDLHLHDHVHGLPSSQHGPFDRAGIDTTASDVAIEALLAGTTKGMQNTAGFDKVFDLTALTEAQQRWARTTLTGGCGYDWTKLTEALAGRKIQVRLGRLRARAMFYPSDLRIVVHRYYYKSERPEASRLLGLEVAHAVDIVVVTADERSRIADMYHSAGSDDHQWLAGEYEDQVGEAFMEGFVAAFCPALSVDPVFSHETTSTIAAGIRSELS